MVELYLNTKNSVFEVKNEVYKDDKIIIFNQNGLNKINYKNELNGSESLLTNFAKVSKISSKVLISGAFSDNYGIKRKSCVVADKGKLLGIQDMCLNYDASAFSIGGSHKIFQTSQGKIGVLVDDDLYNFESVKAMSICDADLIVALIFSEEKPQFSYIIKTYSYLFGVPFVVLTKNSTLISNSNGEIVGGGRNDETHSILPLKKGYRLISLKKRGN